MMEKRGFETGGFGSEWLSNAPPAERVEEALGAAFEAQKALTQREKLERLRRSLEEFSPGEQLPGIDIEEALSGLPDYVIEQIFIYAEKVGDAGTVFFQEKDSNRDPLADDLIETAVTEWGGEVSDGSEFDEIKPSTCGKGEFIEALEEFATKGGNGGRKGDGKRITNLLTRAGIIENDVVDIDKLRKWVESEESRDVRGFGEGSRQLLAKFLKPSPEDDQEG